MRAATRVRAPASPGRSPPRSEAAGCDSSHVTPPSHNPSHNRSMLWLFSKGSAKLRVLTSRDGLTGDWIVELDRPNCVPEIYRFADQGSCEAYLSALEQEL